MHKKKKMGTLLIFSHKRYQCYINVIVQQMKNYISVQSNLRLFKQECELVATNSAMLLKN